MNQELKAYQEELRNRYRGKAFMTPTINTLMTYVVRMKETVVIKMVDGEEYDIRWNPIFAEPEVIEPGTTYIRHHGIVDVVEWLKEVKEGATFRIVTNSRY